MRVNKIDALCIKYRMLSSGYAIITDAEAAIFPTQTEVTITFEGVDIPDDAQLVITVDERSYYRNVASGAVSINGSLLLGAVKMAITSRKEKKVWKCEGVQLTSLDSEKMLFLPYDLDVHKLCRQALVGIDEAEKRLAMQNGEIKELKTRLNEYMEHWDID